MSINNLYKYKLNNINTNFLIDIGFDLKYENFKNIEKLPKILKEIDFEDRELYIKGERPFNTQLNLLYLNDNLLHFDNNKMRKFYFFNLFRTEFINKVKSKYPELRKDYTEQMKKEMDRFLDFSLTFNYGGSMTLGGEFGYNIHQSTCFEILDILILFFKLGDDGLSGPSDRSSSWQLVNIPNWLNNLISLNEEELTFTQTFKSEYSQNETFKIPTLDKIEEAKNGWVDILSKTNNSDESLWINKIDYFCKKTDFLIYPGIRYGYYQFESEFCTIFLSIQNLSNDKNTTIGDYIRDYSSSSSRALLCNEAYKKKHNK